METIYFAIIISVLLACAIFLTKLKKSAEPTRRYLKDVVIGEYIQIEWSRAEGGLCSMKCVNNDPKTKTILLEIRWSNYKDARCLEYQKIVLDYDDDKLKNFHLLNTYKEQVRQKTKDKEDDDDTDIATLQKKMNDAINNEEYEKAEKLQKKIDKLLKK